MQAQGWVLVPVPVLAPAAAPTQA
eukprot:COSAG05_NODE_18955_length_300_cov_0.771144_1_plen_23_part_01